VLNDERAAELLDAGERRCELWAAVSLVGADVGLAVLGHDFETRLRREHSAIVELPRDRSAFVLR
jgi:hypothetical protein